jgi:hypothetical protein
MVTRHRDWEHGVPVAQLGGLAVIVLLGLVFILAGLDDHRLSTHIRAMASTIELTWDNGSVQVAHDEVDLNDPHLVAVKAWGNGVCWLTINDKIIEAKEQLGPVDCSWSRSSS